MDLIEKLKTRQADIAVMGIGYVGLPLTLELARVGFDVTALDVDEGRVTLLQQGKSYLTDIPDAVLAPLVESGKLHATADMNRLSGADAVIICVPTPLTKTRDPNLSYIEAAVESIANNLHPVQLIVLESTTYPGTTEEIVVPRLEKTGFELGKHYHVAFSPERIDPGNTKYTLRQIPKVVGGVTPACTETAAALYSQVVDRVVRVSSPKVAETCKLLENIFRSVNIALVNEMALLSDRMGIDVWEVIEAANTKPYGFMKFTPGPGPGGHCIPIDPFYLSWKAHEYDFHTRFIELSGEVNARMPGFVLDKVSDALNSHGKSLWHADILMLGLAYKADVNDVRLSPSLKVAELLLKKGARLTVSDPYVHSTTWNGHEFVSVPLTDERVRQADCVLLMTNHSSYDYAGLAAKAQLIVDTRNAFAGQAGNIVKL